MDRIWQRVGLAAAIAAAALAVWVAVGCTAGTQRAAASQEPPGSGIAVADATATTGASATPAATSAVGTTSSPGATGSVMPTRAVVPNITVAAVGDMLFDSAPKRLIQAEGGAAPFSKVASRLRSADFTVGNLECPLSKRGAPVPNKTFTFRGDPRATLGLTAAGFDVVSLANNHARDYGATALADTFTNLKKAGVAWAGAGANKAASWKPAIITRKGARIAYLAFSEITPTNFAATSTRSGTAYTLDIDKVCAAIRAAHKQADYVVVSFHWGVERQYSPTARQVRDGRAAIRAGADLVLSHHPHVLEGVEFYRGKLIAYSLGNFVFSPGSATGRDTMVLRATMTPKGVTSVSVEPCWIGQNGRPVPQTGSVAKRILGIIKKTSTARGTVVEISGSTARLLP